MNRLEMAMTGIGVRAILVVFIWSLLIPMGVSAEDEKSRQPQSQSAEPVNHLTDSQAVPDLAEIVPLQIRLVGELKRLERQLDVMFDREQLEKAYIDFETDLAGIGVQLENFKNDQEYKYNKLVDLREEIKQKNVAFDLVNKPVLESTRQLGILRKKWQKEAVRWSVWQDELLKEGNFEQLISTFDHANETNQIARDRILSELDVMLAVQERAGIIEQEIDLFIDEVDSLINEERRNTLFNDTPPMFTRLYFAQLANESVWQEVKSEFYEISLPNSSTVAQHGWIVVLQGFIASLLIIAIHKRKNFFLEEGRWHFFALYPVASGLFLSYVACALMYEYQGVPTSWKLVVTMIGGLSFARLMKGVVDEVWKGHFIYGLVLVVITNELMGVLGVPIPVFRLYVCVAAFVALIFCLHLVVTFKKDNKKGIYFWLIRSGVCLLAVILFFEIWGKKGLSSFLFVSLGESIATILVFVWLMYMINGVLAWMFSTTLLRRSTSLDAGDTETIVIRLTRFFDALVVLFIITPAVLMIWGVYQSLEDATKGVLSFGLHFGDNRITIGLLVISATILYCSFLISWIVQKMLIDQVLFQRQMEKGARISIARLVHYFIVVVGFLFSISALGIEITKLTIMISALGVGIGFGLQGIVNNFVSGIVLLFEQPIRVGDLIEVNGVWGEIKHIGIRSTLVRDFDHADLIVPNADLVSNQVTNWTLGDRSARLIIKVGVAYGSDVNLVMETLVGCGRDNSRVSESHSPNALFLNFGESTLDFELRVFVPASLRIEIRSELHLEIDKRFRENDIIIAFPQRHLHISGMENEVKSVVNNNDVLLPGQA